MSKQAENLRASTVDELKAKIVESEKRAVQPAFSESVW